MTPLIVKYQRSPIGQTAQPPKTLVIGRLSAELFPEWTQLINDGHVDTVIITPVTCTGWRIWVNRDVEFKAAIPDDRHEAMCQEQASWRIVKTGSTLHPLNSPYCLMQEFVERDIHYPWRVLVACLLLNRTHGRVARPAIERLFEAFPTPLHIPESENETALVEKLHGILQPLGFKTMRTNRLMQMTHDYLRKFPFGDMRGVGEYALDSIAIFCWGRTDLEPTDQWLRPYLMWRNQGGPAPQWPVAEFLEWYGSDPR